MEQTQTIQTTGRRKTAVARALVKKGTGKITVNGREYKKYFPTLLLHSKVVQPLAKLKSLKNYDIKINVYGGGITGQAEACRLAVARALVQFDPESKKALRAEGFLTRDSRQVERKKAGQKKARKRFQFTKR
jgi:small subunit ribosomal protein S9